MRKLLIKLHRSHCGPLQLTIVILSLFLLFAVIGDPRWAANSFKEEPRVMSWQIVNYQNTTSGTSEPKIVGNPYLMLSSDEASNIKRQFEVRRRRVQHLCIYSKENPSILESAVSKIIIDEKHGISWCPVYKAASSVWMQNFASLRGLLSEPIMDLIRKNIIQVNSIVRQSLSKDINANQSLEKIEETKKLLIVRHPFERLLSAYRDKLEHKEGREYYYTRFGRHITHRYRRRKNPSDMRLEPTFVEFLEFIVKEKYFDEHWVPYYDSCAPCKIQYDYILKFETLLEEQSIFLSDTGLFGYLYQVGDARNAIPHESTTRTVAKDYFENVPKLLLKEVHKVYEKDFKLFAYSPGEYFYMSLDNNPVNVNKSVI
ncbi:carbohydrate sulfotransferase 11 [Orussus abietinus]|uniref:carbohydrate sulfotransferase 11 n=1 Tax=Orussus abietinus TaxID=222816 RepID=UPI000626B6F6|nr:carbohydrate sulfotransferase 11 [Orussus abietinus]